MCTVVYLCHLGVMLANYGGCMFSGHSYRCSSSCDELMEFKQIQTRAQPEESLKHNHSCTMM